MLVRVSREMAAHLDEPLDFKRFSVSIEAPPSHIELVREELRSVGELVDAQFMWVSQHWLRWASPHAGDEQWQDSLTRMIEQARAFGWISSTGSIRAHVTWD